MWFLSGSKSRKVSLHVQFSECRLFKQRHRVEGKSSETGVIDVTQGFGLLWLRCISEVLKVFKLYLWLRFFRHKIHRHEGQSWSVFSGLVWRRDGDAVLVAETQPVCMELLWKHAHKCRNAQSQTSDGDEVIFTSVIPYARPHFIAFLHWLRWSTLNWQSPQPQSVQLFNAVFLTVLNKLLLVVFLWLLLFIVTINNTLKYSPNMPAMFPGFYVFGINWKNWRIIINVAQLWSTLQLPLFTRLQAQPGPVSLGNDISTLSPKEVFWLVLLSHKVVRIVLSIGGFMQSEKLAQTPSD